MPSTVSHHSVTYMELWYSRRRFSSTNAILLYTVHPQATSRDTSVRPIICIQTYLTIDNRATQGKAWNYTFFGFGNVIGPRFIDAKFYINKVLFTNTAFTFLGNTLEVGTTAEGSIWTGLYSCKFYLRALHRRRQLEGEGYRNQLSAPFTASGHYSRSQAAIWQKRQKNVGGLALELAPCRRSVCVSCLTPWTLR